MKSLILFFLLCFWVGADTGTLIIRTIPICAYTNFPELIGDMQQTSDGWMIENVPSGSYHGYFQSGNKTMQANIEILPKTQTTVIVDVRKMVLATYTDDRNNIDVFNTKAIPEPEPPQKERRQHVSFNQSQEDKPKAKKADFGDVDGIFRIGQERNKTALLDRKLKAKGIYASFEKPILINNNNFLLGYASYTNQNYTNPFPEILPGATGNLISYTGGIKYNFGKDGLSFPAQLERGSFYLRVGWEKAVADYGIAIANTFFSGKISDLGLQYGLGFEKNWGKMGLFLEFIEHRSDIINDTSFNFGITSVI